MKDNGFEVGDKLLCKNSCSTYKISFEKGKEYIITDILRNAWYVKDEEDRFYYINDDNNSKIEIVNVEVLNRFFYTKKEIRYLKLKKLYEGSEF